MNSYIEMSNVTFYYGSERNKKNVLENTSFRFEAGKVYAILGKSGIGKSTTLALLGGLEHPRKGQILFGDKDVSKMKGNEYQRNHMGIVFQNYNLLEYLTVYQNIKIAMDIKKITKENQNTCILELLNKVGLDSSVSGRKVNSLSGGEQQRVAIARAISTDAEILLADEPTGNLDEDTAQGIVDILVSLAHEEGKCVIIVTHSKDIAGCVDEVLMLEDGSLRPI